MTERLADRTGWVVSIVMHGILVLVFLLSRLELKPFILDFTNIAFAPAADIEMGGGTVLPAFGGAEPLIELPRRPMLDETSPLLRLPERERRIPEAPAPVEKPELELPKSVLQGQREELPVTSPGQRERAKFKSLPISDELLTGTKPDALADRLASDEMFSIDWEGPAREKVGGRLPEFPPGVQKAATVRIDFKVAPDGSVVYTAVKTKGLPELEKVALEALRTWRFNPLDKSLPQENQTGVITFIFKLK